MKKATIHITAKNREHDVILPRPCKKIFLGVSRECKDIFCEVVDYEGYAKGKPLTKWLPEIDAHGIHAIRFIMNDFSTKPIDIELSIST